MNIASIRSGIAWDESTGTYAVALGGEVRGRYPMHLQALRALENGTGHVLGSSGATSTRSRRHRGHKGPSGPAPATEAPEVPEVTHAEVHWSDVAAHRAGRVDPPETLRQAQRWDSAFTRYAHAGLCTPCASQAAWGAQIGYSRVRPPCEECAAAVAEFPGAEHVNGWRSWPERTVHHRPRRDSVAARALTAPGAPPPPVADTESAVAA